MNKKSIRKESKKMGESVRKSRPISLTHAPKQKIKKHAKKVEKLNTYLSKKK